MITPSTGQILRIEYCSEFWYPFSFNLVPSGLSSSLPLEQGNKMKEERPWEWGWHQNSYLSLYMLLFSRGWRHICTPRKRRLMLLTLILLSKKCPTLQTLTSAILLTTKKLWNNTNWVPMVELWRPSICLQRDLIKSWISWTKSAQLISSECDEGISLWWLFFIYTCSNIGRV